MNEWSLQILPSHSSEKGSVFMSQILYQRADTSEEADGHWCLIDPMRKQQGNISTTAAAVLKYVQKFFDNPLFKKWSLILLPSSVRRTYCSLLTLECSRSDHVQLLKQGNERPCCLYLLPFWTLLSKRSQSPCLEDTKQAVEKPMWKKQRLPVMGWIVSLQNLYV